MFNVCSPVMTGATPGGPLSTADQLIIDAATGIRQLTGRELQDVLAHVAHGGFDTTATSKVGSLGAGVAWQARTLCGSDRLRPAETHFVRHVLGGLEWPTGTTLQAYLQSIRDVVLDGRSGVLVSRYQGPWQLTVVGRSGQRQGPAGYNWILVEYRVGVGRWVTAYQPRDGLRVLMSTVRTDRQWLRRPT